MKTLLLPTTVGVSESISLSEALEILRLNNIIFEVAGDVVDGMYVADNGEIVAEQLLPINSTIQADTLAQMFTQECILESNGITARLVAQNGDTWADYTQKVEYTYDSIETAITMQEKLAKHFGGASRIGNRVWAWGDNDSISNFVI